MNRIKIRHGLYVAALVAAALVPAPRGASAGLRQNVSVYVYPTKAAGTLGGAYNSADSVQWIGCRVYAYASSSSTFAVCMARDEANNPGSCTTIDAKLVAIATGLDADDYIEFRWDTSGTCTYLNVNRFSSYTTRAAL